MASPTGALTLSQMAAAQTNPKFVRGTLEAIANDYQLRDILPIRNLGGAWAVTAPQINPDNQPAPMYRMSNSDFKFISGDLEKISDYCVPLGGALKIDLSQAKDPTLLFDPATTQMKFINSQIAKELMDLMINGDPNVPYGTDGSNKTVYRPPGLRWRLRTGFNGIDTGCRVNSNFYTNVPAGIDLTNINTTVANNVVDGVEEMIDLIDPDFMIMNYRTRTLIRRSQRLANMLKTTADQFHRPLTTWGDSGVEIIVPKLKSAARTLRNTTDTSLWVMPYEDPTGATNPLASAGSRYGSIIFVRADENDGFCALTPNGLEQRGPKEALPPTRALLYDIEMGIGFQSLDFRAFGQFYNLLIG